MVHTPSDTEVVCLYVSQMALGTDFVEVQRIIQQCRVRNTGLGLRGALVFDGERFGQLFAGPRDLVRAAGARISADAHMTNVRLLHMGTDVPQLLRGWSSGYCGTADLDQVIATGIGAASVDAFMRLLAEAVMD